jgi:von Willebrand factor type D domain
MMRRRLQGASPMRSYAGLLALGLVVGSLVGSLLVGARPASAWSPTSCPVNADDVYIHRADRCIAHVTLGSRGVFQRRPACVELEPVRGALYPSTTWCGRNGAEAIEQGRVIAHLGHTTGGVDPNVQWEVRLYQDDEIDGRPPGRRFADVVKYDHANESAPIDVYELKQKTNNAAFQDRFRQVAEYRDLLDDVTAGTVSLGTSLYTWVDVFAVNTGIQCTEGLNYLDVYVSWLEFPGLYDIYKYRAGCFDYVREPIRQPAQGEIPIPFPSEIRVSPFPSTYWPTPGPVQPPIQVPPPQPTPPGGPPDPPIRVEPPPVPPPPPPPPPPPDWTCHSIFNPVCQWQDWRNKTWFYGHPHVVTIDGLHYDFNPVGEFLLADADDFDAEVQARLVPRSNNASVLSTIALNIDGHDIELGTGATGDTYLRVDHSDFSLAIGNMLDFGDGGAVLHQSDGYYVSWPGHGPRPALWYGYRNAQMYFPPESRLSGLVGNNDGDPSNDLETGLGEQLPSNASPATIHGTFADSWRITQEESMFTYAPGESTETFTDRTFPANIITVGDLSDSELEEASSTCADADVGDTVSSTTACSTGRLLRTRSFWLTQPANRAGHCSREERGPSTLRAP